MSDVIAKSKVNASLLIRVWDGKTSCHRIHCSLEGVANMQNMACEVLAICQKYFPDIEPKVTFKGEVELKTAEQIRQMLDIREV